MSEAQSRALSLIEELTRIATEADDWFVEMDFSFLLDRRASCCPLAIRRESELHAACYDLLASESRIAAFLASRKAKSLRMSGSSWDVSMWQPQPGPALISWAGTMFEYLMPAIWTGSYRDSVLHCAWTGQ